MTSPQPAALIGFLALAFLSCLAAAASAQTSLQIPLQFDFLNPGAKSLGLAGAFTGVADDATATFANPAGLTQLERSEVSVELRGSRNSSRFLERGRLSGAITHQGIDTVMGPQFEKSTSSHVGPGFLSVVYVPKRREISADSTELPQRTWAVAAYLHELVRVDQSFFSQGVFQRDPDEFTSRRDSPQKGEREVSITAYGASGAYRFRRSLSVGASLTAYQFDLHSEFRRFNIQGSTDGFFGPPDLASEAGRSTQEGSTVALAPTIGVLWEQRPWRAGVVYRHGASFGMTTTSGDDPSFPGTFRVPDTLAFGGSVQMPRAVLVTAEITHVSYSRIRETFVTDQARASGRGDSFTIDSGVELHGGVQITRSWKFRPRFRGGLWYDPDHSVHFSPSSASSTALDRLFDERLAAALSTGGNQVHGTAGLGLTLATRLDLNIGVDLASTTRVFSASVILK